MAKAKTFFKKFSGFFISPEITDDKKALNLFYKYFLGGIFIRLLTLPFFFHRDLLSTYQRAADTVFNGNIGSDFNQLLTNIIHSVYLLIAKTIFPFINAYRDTLLNQDTWVSWIEFARSDNIFLILTIFKFLYVIFDFACIFVILRLFYDGEAIKKVKIFKYWMFNPIVIFVIYFFARHDVIGLFITLIGLLLARKKRKYWAVLVVAVAVAIRFFPIMILPILIIYLAEKKKDYIIMFAIGLSGLLSIEVISYVAFGKSLIFSLLNAEHFNYIISSKLDLIVHDRIFIFIAVYTILVLSFIKLKNKSFDLLMSYSAIIYLLYMALSYFHPQYLVWSVPFVLYVAGNQKNLFRLQWLQFVFLLIVLIYWGDATTKLLAVSLDHKFFVYLPGPIPFINRFYDPAKFVNIFRSVFTGISLWMVYIIYLFNKKISGGNELTDKAL